MFILLLYFFTSLLLYCLNLPLSLLNSNYLSSCIRSLSFYCLKSLNILWNSKWFSQPPLIYSFYFFNSTFFFLNSNCSFVYDVSNWWQWIWPGFVPMFHVWTIFFRNDLSNIFFSDWNFLEVICIIILLLNKVLMKYFI